MKVKTIKGAKELNQLSTAKCDLCGWFTIAEGRQNALEILWNHQQERHS